MSKTLEIELPDGYEIRDNWSDEEVTEIERKAGDGLYTIRCHSGSCFVAHLPRHAAGDYDNSHIAITDTIEQAIAAVEAHITGGTASTCEPANVDADGRPVEVSDE